LKSQDRLQDEEEGKGAEGGGICGKDKRDIGRGTGCAKKSTGRNEETGR